MLQLKLWKKVNFAIAVLASMFLFSCQKEDVATPAVESQSSKATARIAVDVVDVPVQLVRGFAAVQRKYGQSQYGRSFEIRVKNLSPTKRVFVHHKKTDGSWTDLEAIYSGALDNGFELWTASSSQLNEDLLADEFVVGYTVNGTTYWDNNDSRNYALPDNDGVLLGKGINVVLSNNTSVYSNNTVYANIDVRNIAPTKKVQIIYTTNNWQSTTTIDAQFVNYYTLGYASITSPNSIGFERWSTYFTVSDPSAVTYYLKYEVNGQVYYDNNFGRNYRLRVQ